MCDFPRITVWMVMDHSKPPIRRYWTGHGWSTDPFMGVRSTHWYSESSVHFMSLDADDCQVALVTLELSRTDGRTVVGNIKVVESVWYGERPVL